MSDKSIWIKRLPGTKRRLPECNHGFKSLRESAQEDDLIWVFHGKSDAEPHHGGKSPGIYVSTDPAYAASFSGPRGDRRGLTAYRIHRSAMRQSHEGKRFGLERGKDEVIDKSDILQTKRIPDDVTNSMDDGLVKYVKKHLGRGETQ